MARLQRVFIGTSELFPFTIMDVLLTFLAVNGDSALSVRCAMVGAWLI
jgi:hypothetical protein